jgi:hypothetical protein
MSMLDTWTDDTAERALHLLRVADGIISGLQHHAAKCDGIRPTTIDRWLIDAAEFVELHAVADEASA